MKKSFDTKISHQFTNTTESLLIGMLKAGMDDLARLLRQGCRQLTNAMDALGDLIRESWQNCWQCKR
jgi:hypothetical protein